MVGSTKGKGRLRNLVVALLAIGVTRSAAGQADPGGPSSWTRSYTEAISRDAGFPRLRDRASPGAIREIRIWWVTGGYMIPESLVRIVESDNGIAGQLHIVWPIESSEVPEGIQSPRMHGLLDARGWRERTGSSECRSGDRFMICAERRSRGVDWTGLMRVLDSLEIERGPGPEPCELGVDGHELVVELRTSTGYDRYECWSPHEGSRHAEARRLAKVEQALRRYLAP